MDSGGQEGHSHVVLSGNISRPTAVAKQQLEHDDNTTSWSSMQRCHGETPAPPKPDPIQRFSRLHVRQRQRSRLQQILAHDSPLAGVSGLCRLPLTQSLGRQYERQNPCQPESRLLHTRRSIPLLGLRSAPHHLARAHQHAGPAWHYAHPPTPSHPAQRMWSGDNVSYWPPRPTTPVPPSRHRVNIAVQPPVAHKGHKTQCP